MHFGSCGSRCTNLVHMASVLCASVCVCVCAHTHVRYVAVYTCVYSRDLQYISMWQYIDTVNKYDNTILYLENIDISKFSSRTVSDCSITVIVISYLEILI